MSTEAKAYQTVRIDHRDAQRLRDLAKRSGMTITGLFRKFTDEIAERLEEKPRRKKARAA